jgi:hypothetical protein
MEIWDRRYNLPLFPELNNPWIYAAYFVKKNGLQGKLDFMSHQERCKRGNEYVRWPDGSGGHFSHDEKIGMAYLCDNSVAKKLLKSLPFKEYRFSFLAPFLQSRAGDYVPFFGKALFSAHCIFSALSWRSGSSGYLKIWLMSEEMNRYMLTRRAIGFWNFVMNKRGQSLDSMLEEHFFQIN